MSSNRSSRVNNVLKNLVLGGAARILSLLFPFITRTVFVRLLGEEYLGVGGLFSSILTLLNLSELGLSSAVVYTMYKPLSEKNDQEVASLLNFYKGIYTKIMLFILGMGLLILPFLGQIVNTELPLAEIRIYYILYLANSAASYLYVWKSSLIQADQKQYIVTGASTLFTMITQIMQILSLLLIPNNRCDFCFNIGTNQMNRRCFRMNFNPKFVSLFDNGRFIQTDIFFFRTYYSIPFHFY